MSFINDQCEGGQEGTLLLGTDNGGIGAKPVTK